MSRSPAPRRFPIANEPFPPQLARPAATPPGGDGWLHEVKWDGYRLLCTVSQGKVALWSRNGLSWTVRVPIVAEALATLGLYGARIDGELVAIEDGRYDFGALQARLAGRGAAPLRYALFDLLYIDGRDISRLPLTERKAELRALLEKSREGTLFYSDHVIGHGETAFRRAADAGLEGIVSKRVNAPYTPGRSDDWRKVRAVVSDEYVVIGYTPGKGSRGELGALLLGTPTGPGQWKYSGRAGSGMSDALARQLKDRLVPSKTAAVSVELPPDHKGLARRATWVRPNVVVDVAHHGESKTGILRQPSLKGIREDKSVADLMPIEPQKKQKRKTAVRPASGLTHPARIVFAGLGLSKQDVADYYRAIMPRFLAELRDRPLLILRCPAGAGKQCFYQKHLTGLGRAVHNMRVDGPGKPASIYVNDEEGVLALVQHNVLEFHCRGATVKNPDRADRIVFDLDPGTGVTWPAVIAAAREVRARLGDVALRTFVRLSGGKGMHVVAPLKPAAPWPAVTDFARTFAQTLANARPDRYVAVPGEKNRRGRIFIDYLRNSAGATSIASYSLRAREGAPVAMPMAWNEIGKTESAGDFDLNRALQRVERQRRDPWGEIDSVRQRLPR